jgi:N-acetylglucosaminyldiphosphoundecaprenol N-acetyl-beta-D-mannosaminyltransferase
LQIRYPKLIISGTAAPRRSDLTEANAFALIEQIRNSRTDLLFAALGQPFGELWLAEKYLELQAICVQVGASIDFIAGHAARAPLCLQAVSLEWAYRVLHEPRRLTGRYWRNALFLTGRYLRSVRPLSDADSTSCLACSTDER